MWAMTLIYIYFGFPPFASDFLYYDRLGVHALDHTQSYLPHFGHRTACHPTAAIENNEPIIQLKMVPDFNIPALPAQLFKPAVDIGRHILMTLTDKQSNRCFDHSKTIESCPAYLGVKNRQRCFGMAQKFGKLIQILYKTIGGFGF